MRIASSMAFALAVAACGVACSTATGESAEGPLGQALRASASANGVPRDLLVAIAQTEGGLDMPRVRDVAPVVALPAAGPLPLRHGKLDTLPPGAALTGAAE